MKSEVLKKFEEMNEKRKISKDLREKLFEIIFENLLIAISVMVLFVSIIYAQKYCSKDMLVTIYKFGSLAILITAIVAIERAYKKENGRQALQGIELLVIGIIVLFANYIVIRGTIFTKLIGVYVAIYYIIKIIVVYKKAKKEYLLEKTDIKEIVKKESKDKIKEIKDIEKLEKNIKKASQEIKQEKAKKISPKVETPNIPETDIQLEEKPKVTRKTKTSTKKSTLKPVPEIAPDVEAKQETSKATKKTKTSTKKSTLKPILETVPNVEAKQEPLKATQKTKASIAKTTPKVSSKIITEQNEKVPVKKDDKVEKSVENKTKTTKTGSKTTKASKPSVAKTIQKTSTKQTQKAEGNSPKAQDKSKKTKKTTQTSKVKKE